MQPAQDKISMYQEFVRLEEQRSKMGLKGLLDATLDYAQYCIRSQFDKGSKGSIKSKKRKHQLSQQFLLAYSEQSKLQKLDSYLRTVRFIRDVRSDSYHHQRRFGDLNTSEAYTRSYNLKIWKRKTLKLDRQLNHMFCSKDDKVKIYDLNNYLLRQSKNKQFHCFVLEALNDKPHLKSRTVHIGFKDMKLYNQWIDSVREGVQECERTRILKELGIDPYQFLDIANRSVLLENSEKIKQIKELEELTEIINRSEDMSEKNMDDVEFQDKDDKGLHKAVSLEVKSETKHQILKELTRKESEESAASEEDLEKQPLGTITKHLLDSDGEQDVSQIEEIEQHQPSKAANQKRNLNLFHQIMPQFELNSLGDQTGYELIESQGQMRIFRHSKFPQKYKFFLNIKDADIQKVFDPIAHVDTYLKWNPSIADVSIKNLIRSQNTAIVYQKHKPYSRIYLARDFIFLRHVFKKDNNLYMVDKSLQNSNYPPFTTIVRGQIVAVWGILTNKDNVFAAADIQIKNQGFLNQGQDHNLSMVYLRGLFQIPGYLMQKGFRKDESVYRMFDLDWDIANNQQNALVEEIRQRRVKEKEIKYLEEEVGSPIKKPDGGTQSKFSKKKNIEESPTNNADKPRGKTVGNSPTHQKAMTKTESTNQQQQKTNEVKIQFKKDEVIVKKQPAKETNKRKASEQQKGQIDPVEANKKLQTHLQIKYAFDQQGIVIIPQDYIKHKYRLQAQPPAPLVLQQPVNGHPIWKGEWIFDKAGGIVFINQKKIEQQKGVLKFILTKIGKNILSGKSILNISLPVDIFAGESNLERLSFAMTYAPIYLEKAAKQKDPLQKLKYCVAFGITNSVLYLNMQKPFNPILGQTFQGWINDCPIYMQQVSHHPPIASFMLFGRGYKITGSLQSKVELHMNSGCGITDGVNRIEFQDGTDICFVSPGGEVSGLTYGDRKFNLVGKSYYWSTKHNIFLELTFDPDKKSFFSVSKKQTTSDYFQGHVMEVTPQFLQTFIKNKKKKESPQVKDIVSQKFKVSGIWCKELFVDGQKVLDLDKDFGCKLQYDKFLLPSDGNWREDIAYRRLLDITRAQNEKERLEVLQRKDRKLREAVHGKKH